MPNEDKQKKLDACLAKIAPDTSDLEAARKKYNEQVKYERDHSTMQSLFGIFWSDSKALDQEVLREEVKLELKIKAKRFECKVKANPGKTTKDWLLGR